MLRKLSIRKSLSRYETKSVSYKQRLIETLETAYRNATQHGTMDITAPNNRTMSFRMLFEDSWYETVNETITAT